MSVLPMIFKRRGWPGSCIVIALCIAVFAPAGAFGDGRQAPGSRIVIDLPESFEVSKLFSGFVHPVAGVSVVLAELPGARYAQVAAGLTDAALGKKGFEKISRGKLARDGEHTYFKAEQSARGRRYVKYVLVLRNDRHVGVITVNVPPDSLVAGAVKEPMIMKALASANFVAEAAPIIKQFSVSKLGPFKEAGKLMGSAILYSTDGRLTPEKPGQSRSMVIIAPSVDRVVVPDIAEFSKRALGALGGYRDLELTGERDVDIAGLKGTHLSAKAVHVSDSVVVQIRQIVLARNGGGYFRLLAIINEAETARLLQPAEELLASFVPKDDE